MGSKKIRVQALVIATCIFVMTAATGLAQEICYADFNCDGQVNLSDFVILNTEYLKADCATTSCTADANDDDVVDLWDLVILKTEFMRTDCFPCA